MSKELKKISPKLNILGNKSTPRSGAFEVKVNGELVFSKFRTLAFPTIEDIKGWIT